MKRKLILAGVLCLASAIAHAGIGDPLNTSIKNLTDLQFEPLKGRVMRCTGVWRDSGLSISLFFMDGIEEGRIMCRLDKGPLDTRLMNKAAQSYGEWRHVKDNSKHKHYYCEAHGGMWSFYSNIMGYPTYFIYSNKVALALNGGQKATPAVFAPDQDL